MKNKEIQEDYYSGVDWFELKKKYKLQSNQLRAAINDRNTILPERPKSLRRNVYERYDVFQNVRTLHRVLVR